VSVAEATRLVGVGVGRGLVVGPVVRVHPAPVVPADGGPPDADVDAAFEAVGDVLRAQADVATGTLADVLRATAGIATDPALREEVARRVAAGERPAQAVDRSVEQFAQMFLAAGGPLAERVTDLRSVRDRVVARLLGEAEPGVPVLARPSVVVAHDLAPADTAALEIEKVLAIVTVHGGPTGHTAIIAGQLGIPCVVRVPGAAALADGEEVAVDAAAGTVERAPGEDRHEQARARRSAAEELEKDTSPGRTAEGHPVALLANVGSPADARRAVGVEGSGLFRTEVLFLGHASAPTLAEQTAAYADVLRAFGGRKVVVRTLDAGADKPLPFADQPGEENPALGVRGYRLVRREPGLLRTQLAALAAAADATGVDPWVMAPMIATVSETEEFVDLARSAGLRGPVGVMVEVPSAALRAADLLAVADFVSLGTNDLAQYTMATDRLRGSLVDLLDPWQPAVLDLVAATARAARAAGKPVGVCGESAADPLMALVLVGLGVTSLSMSAGAVPSVRYAVGRHTRARCAELAQLALASRTAHEARAAVRAAVDDEVGATLGL